MAGDVEPLGGWLAGLSARVAVMRRPFRRRGRRTPTRPVTVLAYLGFGTPDRILVRGRVLEGAIARNSGAGDSAFRNVRNAFLRFETDELPGAVVQVRLADRPDVSAEAVTDEEGYFRAVLAPEPPAAHARGWVDLRLKLLEPPSPAGGAMDVAGQALVATSATRFVLLSDLDDTVLVTQVTRPLRLVLAAMFGNARTRRAFAGVPALYRAFERAGGMVSYVSSGPWNLYDLLQEFLALNEIPVGPMVLRDWGVNGGPASATRRMHHKLREAEEILGAIPGVPCVLLGDSGQEDPEIYAAIVARQPERIALVLIRDVGADSRRRADIARVASASNELGVPFALVADSAAAAEVAVRHGLLAPEAAEEVRRVVAEAGLRPSLPSQP